MVEGEEGSRQANGSSAGAPCQRRTAEPDAGEDTGPPPPGDLAQLLAAVGALLESHAADDLVVLVREELERREFAAYGRGWRDAAAQYHQLAGRAGEDGDEPGDRVPGQAAVIPFRRKERYDRVEPAQLRPRSGGPGSADPYRDPYGDRAAGRRDEPEPGGRAAPATGRARPEPHRADTHLSPSRPAEPVEVSVAAALGSVLTSPPDPRAPRGARLRPSAPDVPAAPSPRPAFATKSRRSKVPTIPRLPSPRRRGSPDVEG
ncbi:hypothetical protein [Streptomyces sp. NPDC059398]|uniref:hypothetical protein n=1 Tax=Streptomyces sp. NPDC059398 TaxID=3346820 RepID=UPI0036B0F9C3